MTLIQSHNFQTSPLAQTPETLIGNISLMLATYSASAKDFLEFTFCFSRSCVDCISFKRATAAGPLLFCTRRRFHTHVKEVPDFPSPTTLVLFRVLGF